MIRTISQAGGNWNDPSTWDEGIVPTSSDDVVARADGTSGDLQISGGLGIPPAQCNNADFTNYTGTLSHAVNWAVFGSLTMVPGMTYSPAISNGTQLKFWGAILGLTLATAGHTLPGVIFVGMGGEYTLQDDLVVRSTSDLIMSPSTDIHQSGCHLILNGHTVTAKRITSGS